MKKFILKWIYRITAINNRKVLLRVANLPANGTVRITKDEEKLLKDMIKYCRPSQVATRNGKAVYRLRDVEGITLWAMLETRRAKDANERIKAWTDDNYEPETIIDAAKLDKFIVKQLEIADGLEQVIFQNMHGKGGESALTGDENIKQAKNLLGLVQITAELFHCSFEDAKQINYSDAMLAIAKRNDEIEKEKRELKKQQMKNR